MGPAGRRRVGCGRAATGQARSRRPRLQRVHAPPRLPGDGGVDDLRAAERSRPADACVGGVRQPVRERVRPRLPAVDRPGRVRGAGNLAAVPIVARRRRGREADAARGADRAGAGRSAALGGGRPHRARPRAARAVRGLGIGPGRPGLA